MSLPDILALARIGLTPAIMLLISLHDRVPHGFGWAALLVWLASFTDWLDGYLARRWGVTHVLGAFLDSTADKTLVAGSLLALISVGRASIWVALVILLREFVVMALRSLAAIGGELVKPTIWGKTKATIQFFAIFLAVLRLAEPWGPMYLDEYVMWIAAVVTLLSGWGYLRAFWSTIRQADATA